MSKRAKSSIHQEKDVDEHQLLQQIKMLQDELIGKDEESYITIANLKEENGRLQRLV